MARMPDPLVDVGTLVSNGLACAALPSASLFGRFALILRGTCTFAIKMQNAVNAGAAGVVFYDTPNDAGYPFSPSGLSSFFATCRSDQQYGRPQPQNVPFGASRVPGHHRSRRVRSTGLTQ